MNKYAIRQKPLAVVISSVLATGAANAAVITVDVNNDLVQTGECSIRAALDSINAQTAIGGCVAGDGIDDEIVFDSLVTGTIELTQGSLPIEADTIITGPGRDQLTIDAAGQHRVVSIFTEGTDITISGVTLSGGYNNYSSGGAIWVRDHVTLNLSDCAIINSYALVSGGAIHLNKYGHAIIDDCIISHNVATDGGGISMGSRATLAISNSEIRDNLATGSGGGIFQGGQSASTSAAVHIDISDTLIANNHAEYSGGGIFNIGSGVYLAGDSPQGGSSPIGLRITDGTVEFNSAPYGAGLYVRSSLTHLEETTITSNAYSSDIFGEDADHGNRGYYYYVSGLGGGILGVDSRLLITDSTVSHNVSPQGGGLYALASDVSINDSTLSGNYGAAIFAYDSALTIANSDIHANMGYMAGGIMAPETDLLISGSHISENTGGYVGGVVCGLGQGCIITDSSIISNGGLFGVGGLFTLPSSYASGYPSSDTRGFTEAVVANTTISGNVGSIIGGVAAVGDTRIHYSTIAHNLQAPNESLAPSTAGLFAGWLAAARAVEGGAPELFVGGLFVGADTWLRNTIVAGNTSEDGFNDIMSFELPTSPSETDAGPAGIPAGDDVFIDYSLVHDPDGFTAVGDHNLFEIDPLLGPLNGHGNLHTSTLVHSLLSGSPAIDSGDPDPTFAPEFDQRGPGFPRIEEGRIDMGAFEYRAPLDAIFSDRFEE